MKKFLLAFVLLIGVSSFNNNTAEAQNVNININIGSQPSWGPVGHDYAGYYYFPDIDCYYDVNVGMYYYSDRGRWVSGRYLPYAYRNYDLYGLYKVVLNVSNPWQYNRNHRRDYARYVGHRNQRIIRDSRDNRYRSSRQNNVVWYSNSSNSHNNSRPHNNNNVGRPTNSNRPNNNNNSGVNRPNHGGNNTSTRPNSSGNVSRPNNNSNNATRPNNSGSVSRPNNNSNSGSNVSRPSSRPSSGRDSNSSTRSSSSSSSRSTSGSSTRTGR